MEHQLSDGLGSQRHGAALPAGSGLVAALLAVAGCAWLISARLATPEMRLGVLTGGATMPRDSQMGMSGAASTGMGAMSMSLGAFIVTWTVMMVAMMVPSLIPAARTFAARACAMGSRGGNTALFIVGYLLVWSVIGAFAYLVVQTLQGSLPTGTTEALRIGAVLLIVAGVYQLTPLKQACLRHCRSTQAGVARRTTARTAGYLSAVRAGLEQGLYCMGSSWPLMLVLLLVGMMNLAWMGVIAGIIVVEKAAPGGPVISKVVGWALAGCGVILLVAPHALPA